MIIKICSIIPKMKNPRKIKIVYHDTKHDFKSLILKHSDGISNKSLVLDAGCGDGSDKANLSKVLKHEKNPIITGIDIDSYAVEKNPWISIRLIGDIEKLSSFTLDAFDIIYSKNVFEHLKSPEKALRQFYKCLKPGGKVILFQPNNKSPLWLTKFIPLSIKHLYKKKLMNSNIKKSEVHKTYYRLNLKKLEKMINLYHNIEVHYYNGIAGYFNFCSIIKRIATIFENIFKKNKLNQVIILEK
jgi:SAM-dependent methyltransferase